MRLPEALTPCPTDVSNEVGHYLDSIDPRRRTTEPVLLDPFPWTLACEDLVVAGDRLRLTGIFVEELDRRGAEHDYRGGAATILVAQGPVVATYLASAPRTSSTG